MWYCLRHDNEFMYEMVICCNVKWPAHHSMMAEPRDCHLKVIDVEIAYRLHGGPEASPRA